MRLAGPYTHLEADERSRAAMRAIVRKRGGTWVEGKGEPPGKQQGPGPRNLDGQGYCTHAAAVLPSKLDALRSYVEVTDDMAALKAGTERVDGKDVQITRTGVELERSAVIKDPDAEMELRR